MGGTKNELCDIGTKFLFVQCFVTTDMFLFSISIIPEDLETSRRDLAFGSVKTRFKAILKKLDLFLPRFVRCSFLEDAQSFKIQEMRLKLKIMYFVVRPCKRTKN